MSSVTDIAAVGGLIFCNFILAYLSARRRRRRKLIQHQISHLDAALANRLRGRIEDNPGY